jgi:S-formylglutathione hydrolase FrmB
MLGNRRLLVCLMVLLAVPAVAAQRGGFGGGRDVIPDGSRVRYLSFESRALGREVPYALYLPPSYDASEAAYPVLFFLHGANENERRWSTRGETDLMLDRMVADGEIGEFVVAIPFGANSFYTNSIGGERWEDMVIQEFIPMIESNYRVTGDRSGRAISGISMGGYGALKLAMQHPGMFNAVSAHSAMLLEDLEEASVDPRRAQLYTALFESIFGISESMDHWNMYNPKRMARESDLGDMAIYFDCGTEDEYGFFVGAEKLHDILEERGIAHEFHLYSGEHGWDYAREHTPASLAFHWAAFSGG